jgi:hypothetical protein
MVLAFASMAIFKLVKNIASYARFGITTANDYYTSHDTLKMGAMLLSVFAGETLFVALLSTFYV